MNSTGQLYLLHIAKSMTCTYSLRLHPACFGQTDDFLPFGITDVQAFASDK